MTPVCFNNNILNIFQKKIITQPRLDKETQRRKGGFGGGGGGGEEFNS